ncbi:RAB11-binding protein RELCH homolog [Cydia strobilella]|uniref:RAB11-binding protein RELCH homolog n=1 Tax=Cydia strobilella TaxID=1100964 RepID=UPI0030071160
MNPYKDLEESSFTAAPHLTYEDIATKLLKDHYFLTALELHTELVESGKELPQLREFFSNPGNFEQHVSRASEFVSMHRSPSQATLDSLDTARYSEDGGGDRGGSGGDVAVLEFELRKAKETIHALRANLTQFADGESGLDKNSKDPFNKRSLKPHERRALNFLINEYLLLQDYKLTSITFSDENPDQDFEDWDDVGLNMPRPSGLMSLFWGNSTINVPKTDACTETSWQCSDMECQTDCDDNVCVSCQTSFQTDTDWNHEILIQAEEIELLKQKIILLETEKLNFQKLYDAAIVSLNSLTSPGSESKGLELHIPEEKMTQVIETIESRPLPCTATENHYGSGQSTHSATPDQFEMIDSEKNSAIVKKEGSNTSSFEPALLGDVTSRGSPTHGSVTTLDDTLSMNYAAEWTRVHYDYDCKEMWIDSGLPNTLKLSLINWCSETLSLNEPLTNELLAELVNSDKPVTLSELLTLVADTMPKVLPHTLVARRCEAAALLASCAALLPPGDARRARTLQTLLTLVKKPEPADTRAICEASCVIVKWGGAGEVLSSVAELLASRSTERRILASQICVAIAPYVPIELCTSLLLSLVTLMCESSEPEIRSIGLKSACLICPVAEHKYGQLENLMFSFLKDPVDKNIKDAVRIFVPLLARSALISGKFSTELCTRILSNLIKASKENESKSVILYLEVMRVLVLSKLAYVVNVQMVREVTPICDTSVMLQDVLLESEQDSFMDLQCYFTENVDAKGLLVAMNSLLLKEDVRWAELNWFIDIVKQILEIAANGKALNHPTIYELLISLFSSYVDNFGAQFALSILTPIFMEIIVGLEQKMEKLHSVNVEYTVVVGVYLVAVLPAQGDLRQQAEFLQKWIVYGSIRGLPVKMFSIPLKWSAKHRPLLLDSYLQHLREFTVHSSAGSRVYISTLLAELLSVCDVDEGSIERQLIPAVMALLNDDDASVRESAITCWGSVTRACLIHGYTSEAQCWPSMEHIISTGRLSVKEVARAAEALALLVLPTAENAVVSERAVSLLCTLAGLCTSPEGVCALTPGLQLAAHHAAHHPALLPALRKLEEIVQTPGFTQYKPSIEVLLHKVPGAAPREPAPTPARGANMAAAHEVGRRVSIMFQQKTNMMPNIFKKKT